MSETTAALDSELGQIKKFSQPPSLSNEPRTVVDVLLLNLTRLKWQRWAPLLAVALVLVVGFTMVRGCEPEKPADTLKGLGPGLYRPTKQTNSGELLPLPGTK